MSEPFDRALRAAARRGRGTGTCPDAEQLAAYADGVLPADERRVLERHAADCHACLQHLALLADAGEQGKAPQRAPLPWLGHWRWLVPLATAVLVVVVWTGLHPRQWLAPAMREVTVEPLPENPFASETASPTKPAPPASSPPAARSRVEPPSAARAEDARRVTPAIGGGPAHQRAPLQAHAPEGVADAARPATGEPLTESVTVLSEPTPPRPTPAARVALPAPAAPAADTANGEFETGEFAAVGAGRAARDTAAPAESLMRKVAGESRQAIDTAWGARYRTANGRIERSEDAGVTWHRVHDDPQVAWVEIVCGTPDRICWAGGTAGAVVRIAREGAARRDLPVRAAVTSIAPHGRSEVLVTVEGGIHYRTTDEGRTWERHQAP